MPIFLVLQTTEHPDCASRSGSVEWHRQMLYKPGPIHQSPWISGLEEDKASTSQIPRQCSAYQVRDSAHTLLQCAKPEGTQSHTCLYSILTPPRGFLACIRGQPPGITDPLGKSPVPLQDSHSGLVWFGFPQLSIFLCANFSGLILNKIASNSSVSLVENILCFYTIWGQGIWVKIVGYLEKHQGLPSLVEKFSLAFQVREYHPSLVFFL